MMKPNSLPPPPPCPSEILKWLFVVNLVMSSIDGVILVMCCLIYRSINLQPLPHASSRLSANNIGDGGMQAFSTAAKHLTSLQEL